MIKEVRTNDKEHVEERLRKCGLMIKDGWTYD